MESSCTECGDLITPSPFAPKSRPQLYCSKRCRWRAKNRRRADYHRSRDRRDYFAQYAKSDAGKAAQQRYRAKHTREAKHRRAQRKLTKAAQGIPAKGIRYMGWCRHCGSPFIDSQPERIFCSRHCGNRHGAQRAKAVGKLRTTPSVVPRFYRQDILKRDGWICQLCGEPIRTDVEPTHPHAPTLDHIIPLAQGGTHNASNCQAAHLQCNRVKGDCLPVAQGTRAVTP